MKVVQEKRILLTKKEDCLYQGYLKWLVDNPCPCVNCDAAQRGKCETYSIWSKELYKLENCTLIKDWIGKRDFAAINLDAKIFNDSDLKECFESEYYLRVAERELGEKELLYKMSKNKYDKLNFFKKINIDASLEDEEEDKND